MTSIQATAPLSSVKPSGVQPRKSRVTPARTEQPAASSLKADVVDIKKGVLPSLKGTGAGALLAGGSSLAIFSVLTGGKPFAGSGGLVSGPVTIVATLGGAVGGAASANFTESKSKGALVGGLAGAGTGAVVMAVVGLKEGSLGSMLQGALTGALVGGITGSVGGVGGAMVAQQK